MWPPVAGLLIIFIERLKIYLSILGLQDLTSELERTVQALQLERTIQALQLEGTVLAI